MEVWLVAEQLSRNGRRLHTLSVGRAIEDGMGKDVGLSDDGGHEADVFWPAGRGMSNDGCDGGIWEGLSS
jgi:hypothetical protein